MYKFEQLRDGNVTHILFQLSRTVGARRTAAFCSSISTHTPHSTRHNDQRDTTHTVCVSDSAALKVSGKGTYKAVCRNLVRIVDGLATRSPAETSYRSNIGERDDGGVLQTCNATAFVFMDGHFPFSDSIPRRARLTISLGLTRQCIKSALVAVTHTHTAPHRSHRTALRARSPPRLGERFLEFFRLGGKESKR